MLSHVQSSSWSLENHILGFLTGIKAYKNSTSCKGLTDLILLNLSPRTDLLKDLRMAKSSSSEPGHMNSTSSE